MVTKYKPHELAALDVSNSRRRRIVEVISYPIPNGDKPETIMVRMVPGEQTTLAEVLSAPTSASPASKKCPGGTSRPG